MPPKVIYGSYSIDLNDKKLEMSVAQSELAITLDESALFSVTCALSASSIKELKDFPKKAAFKWQDKGIFKGELANVSLTGHSKIALIYRDRLDGAKKHTLSSFVKRQSLQHTLSTITDKIGLCSRFYGDFSTEVPGFTLANRTLFEHLQALSSQYGFHFVCRSFADQVAFIRVGSYIREATVSHPKDTIDIRAFQSADEALSEIRFRYFDPRSMEVQEKHLTQSNLYQPLSDFRSHYSFKDKLSWASAEGMTETHVTDRYHFETGESLLRTQLSKKLMQQESLRLRCFKPLGLPGDKIQLEQTPAPRRQEGNYLVQASHISIQSAIPKMELVAMRP